MQLSFLTSLTAMQYNKNSLKTDQISAHKQNNENLKSQYNTAQPYRTVLMSAIEASAVTAAPSAAFCHIKQVRHKIVTQRDTPSYGPWQPYRSMRQILDTPHPSKATEKLYDIHANATLRISSHKATHHRSDHS